MTRARPERGRWRGILVPVTICLAFALWRTIIGDPLTNSWQDRSIDTRFAMRGSRPVPDNVVLVAIDEAAIDRFGWSPPPRDLFASAIRTILSAKPASLAIDMLFIDVTARDASLRDALEPGAAQIVLGTAAQYGPESTRPHSAAIEAALVRSAVPLVVGDEPRTIPAPRLFASNDALLVGGRLGHVNIIASPDRVARRVPLTEWVGNGIYLPSLALAAAEQIGAQADPIVLHAGESVTLAGHFIPTDRNGAVLVDYYGKRGAIATYSVGDVVDGKVPLESFAGHVVFMGITAESLSDEFATAFDPHMPGVEILATLAANLLAGDLLVQNRWTGGENVALGVFLASALLWSARVHRLLVMAVTQLALWLAGLGTLLLAFAGYNQVLDAPALVFALVVGTTWGIGQRVLYEVRRSSLLANERRNLARYVSPLLADDLARSQTPDFADRTQTATVIFVDLAGFTTLSEALSPADTQKLLHSLHHVYESCASQHLGVVAGFWGDVAMIAFGLPMPQDGDAARALACGRALLKGGEQLTAPYGQTEPLRLRVSAHSGPVVAGTAGGEHQAQVTLNGDTVNVASRLQEVAKAYGVTFVVSRVTLELAGRSDPLSTHGFARLATASIRGRVEPIEVWAA